jgi:hypothetical protein
MVGAVRQSVIIGSGGKIELTSPDLKEGQRAEVIVLVESRVSVGRRLAALDRLQKSLNLDEDKARQWIRQARAERESYGPQE